MLKATPVPLFSTISREGFPIVYPDDIVAFYTPRLEGWQGVAGKEKGGSVDWLSTSLIPAARKGTKTGGVKGVQECKRA